MAPSAESAPTSSMLFKGGRVKGEGRGRKGGRIREDFREGIKGWFGNRDKVYYRYFIDFNTELFA